MTAHEFLVSEGVLSIKESYSVYKIQKWLEEYANIVLSIAAEKAEIKAEYMVDCLDSVSVCKESILNCLKD